MKTAVTALTGSLALAASLGVCSIAYGAETFAGSTDFESISLTDPLFDGDIDDSSIVTDATVELAASRPTNYNFASNRDKVLSVETSGTLWRYLDSSSNAVSTASDTIYADLLVKCENVVTDNDPTPSSGDQLLVYFKENGGTTNLCVVALADIVNGETDQYNEDGIAFTLDTPAEVGAIAGGNWYRLVIEALNDVTPGDGSTDPGFQLYLGGYGDDYLCTSGSADAFQSLTATDSGDGSITSIGFRGNGSVDDLVLSTLDPSVDATDWATYLGAAVDGAYGIDDETELKAFQQGVANGLPTANKTFKLTGNIALTEAWPGIGTYDNTVNANAFQGTFDGAGYRISNVVFADNLPAGGSAGSSVNNYRGFFNQVYNATIQNLTVQWVGWVANIGTTEFGGAALVGCANNSTLQGLTAEGTITAGTHNNAGIVVRASGLTAPTTISACTNKMAITGNYTKVGGICAITQSGTSTVTFDACVNEGAISAVAVTGATNAGRDGLAGILAYAANGDGKTIINACVNAGTIDGASGFSGSHSGYTGAKAGQLLGWANNSASLTGANTVKDDYLAVGAYTSGKTSGQNFATVAGTTATMIADSSVVAGVTQYKAMTEKAAFVFTAAGSLIVDEALKTAAVSVSDPTALELTTSTSGTVKTYTAAPPAAADWADPATITEGTTAAEQYSELGKTELSNADAKKLTQWADTYSVDYADVTAAPGDYVDAFLLNCAPADVDAEKAAFVATITIDGNGDVVVTPPEGKTYNAKPQLNGKASLTDAVWTPLGDYDSADTTGYQFFTLELSL